MTSTRTAIDRTFSRPSADAWCVYELDTSLNPTIIESYGVSKVERVDTCVSRVYFTNPERFSSGCYACITQPELAGYNNTENLQFVPLVHGSTSNSGATATGFSASCDICCVGLSASSSATAVRVCGLLDATAQPKYRVNAAFFCMRNDADTNKIAVRNLLPSSQDFGRWGLAANITSRIGINSREASPVGYGPVYFLNGYDLGQNYVYQFIGDTFKYYTYSLYGKADTGLTLQLLCGGGSNNFGYYFNLKNGALTQAGSTSGGKELSGYMQDVGRGWKRCVMTFRTPNTPAPLFQNDINNTNLFVFGAQLEEGTVCTDYIATDSSGGTLGNQDLLLNHTPGGYGMGSVSSQNLFYHSESFNNALWVKNNLGVTYGNYVDPLGSTGAFKIFDYGTSLGSSPYNRLIYQTSSFPSNTEKSSSTYRSTNGTFTVSVYAKAAERKYLQFGEFDTGSRGRTLGFFGLLNFDLERGIVTQNSGLISAGMVSVGNGWWRCYATSTDRIRSTSGLGLGFGIANRADGAERYGATYATNGLSGNGILLWGAQAERGILLSNYTKTTSAVAGTTFGRVYGITAAGVCGDVTQVSSTLSVIPSAREATAWGTIVIPPIKSASDRAGAYLENSYGIRSVVQRANNIYDLYFNKKMDTEGYCVITTTEQESSVTNELSVSTPIPETEYKYNILRNEGSGGGNGDQKTVDKFTISSLTLYSVAGAVTSNRGKFLDQSIWYQSGLTQRIHFMVFGGRGMYGTE